MKRLLSILSLILLLPQCSSIRPKKIFDPIKIESKKRINAVPEWMNTSLSYATLPQIEQLTLQEAIAVGLQHNPTLQAHFEELGIRKSDLIQAGFYTNPGVETIFRIPTKDNDTQTTIEISANFMLSDLWQVPFKKKVAQRNLEIKTHEIMSNILATRKNIQHAYLNCKYQQEYLELVKEITAVVQDIKNRIEYRYQFGYNTKLDHYFSLSKFAEWQAKIIDTKAALQTSYTTLYQLLGTLITNEHITLADSIEMPLVSISQQELEQYAMLSHPDILIEQSKIAKARAEVSYEKSRVIDDVQIGVSYERDFEKNVSGVGPSFGINIPLFNTNYGNIERAKFEIKQAEKSLLAQQRMIFANISNQLSRYNAYLAQIEQYRKNVLPPVMQAIEFSKEFFDKMQMSMIVFLDTQIDLFQSKIKLLDLSYQASQEYIDLEFNVGAQLENIQL